MPYPRRIGRIFIGTAGWSVPRAYEARFPVEGSHLRRYSSVFPAAEINSSFYRSHRKTTFDRWARSTPEHFRFSVKAPKAVTHAVSFEEEPDLDAFFAELAGLGSKCGPILIQLPPKRSFDEAEAIRLLSAFRARTDSDIALEPRHPSWFGEQVDNVLITLRIARVAADPPRRDGADRPGGWLGLVYYRLHGSPDVYRSSYGTQKLAPIAQMLERASKTGAEVWCIFDNTAFYAATADALDLLVMTLAR